MRDFFVKPDLSPQQMGEAVVAVYRKATQQSLTTLWQRTLSLNGVPGDHWTVREGNLIARALDKHGRPLQADAAMPVSPVATPMPGGESMTDSASRARKLLETEQRHRREKQKLARTQQERHLIEARQDKKRHPGLLKIVAGALSRRVDADLLAQQKAAMAEFAARRKRDGDEIQTLLRQQEEERQGLLSRRATITTHAAGAPGTIDLVTRQELVNTHILAQATQRVLKARPLPSEQVGLLCLAALTQSLSPSDPLLRRVSLPTDTWAKDDDPIGKIRADIRVMAFGLSADSALDETARLERQFTIAPTAVQQQALRVERLLQVGFASSAAQIFNPNLAAIKAAIAPRITALAIQPQPPSGQVIPFPAAALRA